MSVKVENSGIEHSKINKSSNQLKVASIPDEYIDSPAESSDLINHPENEESESTKQSSQEEKPFATLECELDFEDEAESALDKVLPQNLTLDSQREAEQATSDCEQSEDGQCTPEKKIQISKKGNDDSVEEGEDDGECTDGEDDLEEGELKDENGREENSSAKSSSRQVCRFYNRGQCFYGNVCRFLHLNFDKTGNYNMFAPAPRTNYSDYDSSVPLGSHGMMNHRTGSFRSGADFVTAPSLPPSTPEPATLESAWERGLREAKELVKKANKRKEEPDFEEKRLNLSLVVNEKNVPPFEKENDPGLQKKKKVSEEGNFPFKYDDTAETFDNEYESRIPWREGRFENFEIRYKEDRRDRGRERIERERFPKAHVRDEWRDDRLHQVQARSRVEQFFDPWRRSKSPKGNRHSRSRSGSYSSVSSYSYSDRSSRSSCSYSRSSSRSSRLSSRSPMHQKRKSPPPISAVSSKTGPNKFISTKPATRIRSSRSRSRSKTPSISRSRSYSRSISMDSVSSASSSISRSTSGSRSPGHRSAHTSILKQEEKSLVENVNSKPTPTAISYQDLPKLNKLEKAKEIIIGALEDERDPLEEKFQMPLQVPFPSLQHLLPTADKIKEPVKGLHKQQIKLTLLNKNLSSKVTNLPKKEVDANKLLTDESVKNAGFQCGVKRPLSPPPITTKPTPILLPKKSASSRRDELLKQLKAVEDAIARKRAKFG